MRESICGAILAGGEARRMDGADKALLVLNGRPLVEIAIERARHQVGRLAISANGDPSRFGALGVPVLPDAVRGAGPLGGLLSALRWARERHPECSRVATFAVDTPFFPANLVARLALALESGARVAVAASAGRLHPVFSLWPIDMEGEIAAALREPATPRLRDLAGRSAAIVTFEDRPADPFFNINRPADLARARELVCAGRFTQSDE